MQKVRRAMVGVIDSRIFRGPEYVEVMGELGLPVNEGVLECLMIEDMLLPISGDFIVRTEGGVLPIVLEEGEFGESFSTGMPVAFEAISEASRLLATNVRPVHKKFCV